jgi:hypothetical protein
MRKIPDSSGYYSGEVTPATRASHFGRRLTAIGALAALSVIGYATFTNDHDTPSTYYVGAQAPPTTENLSFSPATSSPETTTVPVTTTEKAVEQSTSLAPQPVTARTTETATTVEAATTVSAPAEATTEQYNFPGPASGETLPVTVYLPSDNLPHPLVMFSIGRGATLSDYEPFFRWLNTAGFVVAAPDYPDNSLANPNAVAEWPIKAEALSYALTSVLGQSNLTGRINPSLIFDMGHSDGGAIAIDAGCDPATYNGIPIEDRRFKAIISLAGADTFGVSNCPPLLMERGTADSINGDQMQEADNQLAATPKYFASIAGAPHEVYTNLYADELIADFMNQIANPNAPSLPQLIGRYNNEATLIP